MDVMGRLIAQNKANHAREARRLRISDWKAGERRSKAPAASVQSKANGEGRPVVRNKANLQKDETRALAPSPRTPYGVTASMGW